MKASYKALLCLLVLAGQQSIAAAQNPPLVPPPSARGDFGRGAQGPSTTPSPGYQPCPPGAPGTANGSEGDNGDLFASLDRESGSLTSGVAFGAIAAAGNMNGGFIGTFVTPAISAGLLTSANAESPYALDRVFFYYSYYDQFRVSQTQFVGPDSTPGSSVTGYTPNQFTTTSFPGFNLNRFDIGLEKTILGGLASFYIRAPFLAATSIAPGLSAAPDFAGAPAPTPINQFDGVGNVNAGLKFMLHQDYATGNVFSAGITIAAPTARATQYVRTVRVEDPNDPTLPPIITYTSFEKVNPTFIQPWVAGQLNYDRWFLQGFLGVLAPTSDQVVTTLNPNIATGYEIYRGTGMITSITPYVNCQVLAPFRKPTDALVDFPTQVFLTEGVNVFIGERTAVFGGVVTPVAGPQVFDIGASAGINYFF